MSKNTSEMDEVKETEKHKDKFLCECGCEIEIEEGQEEFECPECGVGWWIDWEAGDYNGKRIDRTLD